jgi:hypothetical protein
LPGWPESFSPDFEAASPEFALSPVCEESPFSPDFSLPFWAFASGWVEFSFDFEVD